MTDPDALFHETLIFLGGAYFLAKSYGMFSREVDTVPAEPMKDPFMYPEDLDQLRAVVTGAMIVSAYLLLARVIPGIQIL